MIPSLIDSRMLSRIVNIEVNVSGSYPKRRCLIRREKVPDIAISIRIAAIVTAMNSMIVRVVTERIEVLRMMVMIKPA